MILPVTKDCLKLCPVNSSVKYASCHGAGFLSPEERRLSLEFDQDEDSGLFRRDRFTSVDGDCG